MNISRWSEDEIKFKAQKQKSRRRPGGGMHVQRARVAGAR